MEKGAPNSNPNADKHLQISVWERRVHESEGTVRYDGGPLTITPYKNQIHISGATRRELNAMSDEKGVAWPDDVKLAVNGTHFGQAPEEKRWSGGGLGWEITDEQIEAIVPEAVRNPTPQSVDGLPEFPRVVIIDDDTVSWMGIRMDRKVWIVSGGYWDEIDPEPEVGQELYGNGDEPVTREQAVDRQGGLFVEGQRFKQNTFSFQSRLSNMAVKPPGWSRAWSTAIDRRRAYEPLYDAEIERYSELCVSLYHKEKAEAAADAARAAAEKQRREQERWNNLSEGQRQHELRGRERQQRAMEESDRRMRDYKIQLASMTDTEYGEMLREDRYSESEVDQLVAERAAWTQTRLDAYLRDAKVDDATREQLVADWPTKRV